MPVHLSEEQRMLVEAVRDIAAGFGDDALTGDEEAAMENLRELADHGFVGVNLPEEYGGGGMTEFEHILVSEVVGSVCPDTATLLNAQSMISPRAIELFGSESLKERYLPRCTSGELLMAVGISEPEAGSDVANMSTRVYEDGGGDLYLDGEKTWVSNFPRADAAVIWARFPEGIGTVVIDLDSPHVEVSNHYTNMAGGTQTHFFINDMPIDPEAVLTRGEESFGDLLHALNWERCATAANANAVMICAFDRAVEYANDRVQFGEEIASFQGMQWKFADMAKRIEASRSLTYRVVRSASARGAVPDKLESNIAKLYACESAERVVSEALQVHGANGYQRGHPLEYLYRLARGKRIGGGTDEIHKNTIGREVLSTTMAENLFS